MLVETINDHKAAAATDPMVLGPFRMTESPVRELGAHIDPSTAADAQGRFWFRSCVPSPYPIPTDGPVTAATMRSGRLSAWRSLPKPWPPPC